MRPFLLHIICIVMLFSSCNWVNDDLSDCPTGTWLKISYTYNILDVDAASSQVGDITIFAFDKNNKYVDRLDVDSIALHQGYCMVRVPFPEGSYHLLLWGGASDRQYRFPYLKTGQTERKSLLLSLICNSEKQMNGKLNGLFYGSLENITISNDYQVLDAPLRQKHQLFLMHPSEWQQPAESGRFHFHIGGCQWCDGSYQHSVGDGAGLLSSIPAGSQYTR